VVYTFPHSETRGKLSYVDLQPRMHFC